MRREEGFTLIELMITMVIFVLVIAASANVFTGLLTQFKQQSKIVESNIEGIVGLELLKHDIRHAGYGIPWIIPLGYIYSEATVLPGINFNEADDGTTSDPPRAVISGNDVDYSGSLTGFLIGTDYLVVKSVVVARNNASQRWAMLTSEAPSVVPWTPASEELTGTDRVIVLRPGSNDTNARRLVENAGAYYTTYAKVTAAGWPPPDRTATRVVYGIDPSTVNFPFNRAEYYVRRPATNMPLRCAPGTGVLYKATVNQDGGGMSELPLLDCVADLQADFWLDTDGDGTIDWPPVDSIAGMTAQQIRDQVREIRVYVVTHEGQKDVHFDFTRGDASITSLAFTEVLDLNSRNLTFTDLSARVGSPEYRHYRWRLYALFIQPVDLLR
ncbi:MAG: prepilin-type N-terminal cleavage/methylation domain-containing protein [Nitrospirota bacterium]